MTVFGTVFCGFGSLRSSTVQRCSYPWQGAGRAKGSRRAKGGKQPSHTPNRRNVTSVLVRAWDYAAPSPPDPMATEIPHVVQQES